MNRREVDTTKYSLIEQQLDAVDHENWERLLLDKPPYVGKHGRVGRSHEINGPVVKVPSGVLISPPNGYCVLNAILQLAKWETRDHLDAFISEMAVYTNASGEMGLNHVLRIAKQLGILV